MLCGAHSVTDPTTGAFYKHIPKDKLNRTYNVTAHANGHESRTIECATGPGGFTACDVELARSDAGGSAMCVEAIRISNLLEAPTEELQKLLGPPDGEGLTLESLADTGETYIVLDMGRNTPVTDGDGDGFTVHLSDDGDYEVYVLRDLHDGKFSNRIPAGAASATRSFDLNGKISSARYVMVTTKDDNDIELDAVQRKGSPTK